jgi:hypothetical protein
MFIKRRFYHEAICLLPEEGSKKVETYFTEVGGLTCRWQRQLIKRRFYNEVNCLNPEEGMEKSRNTFF